MPATFVESHLHFNNPITNICYTILMISPTHVLNVVGLLRNFQLYKIMKEFTVENDHLLVKLVEKVLDKEFLIWCIGNQTIRESFPKVNFPESFPNIFGKSESAFH